MALWHFGNPVNESVIGTFKSAVRVLGLKGVGVKFSGTRISTRMSAHVGRIIATFDTALVG